MRATSGPGSGPSFMRSASVEPSTISITMKASTRSATTSSPTSKSVTRPGWLRPASMRTSPSWRSTSPGSAESVAKTLTATSRPSVSSAARYTVAMPPRPSSPLMR
ncbi:hypothetical protein CMMCAS04_00235 [Clavibacter michiganensis subsp. michiganensis]|nr:hypothetical protein CMMCAS04_00235 [Clavibacter michiganensis subsp. michiganensis]